MKRTKTLPILISLSFILSVLSCCEELYSQMPLPPEIIKPHYQDSGKHKKLELIRPDTSNTFFVTANSNQRFIVWGFNYDHDTAGRLIEDYWQNEWNKVEKDFEEMKHLGANVVRIHLQFSKFMNSSKLVDKEALVSLKQLIGLAERIGLYLDITGLGCYHKEDVPVWYDTMNESDRWAAQCLFWEAIAKTCASSPAIFCYDLMNEPILGGENLHETEWLGEEFGGKYFTQRITLDLAGRTPFQVARAWVDKLVAAIRLYDKQHMITVGEIPWAYVFPGAKPFFGSDEVGKNLDFVSVHYYPKKDDVQNAIKSLIVYDVGKPIVIEEIFPLQCSIEEMDNFIESSRYFTDGWIGFYWGHRLEDYKYKKHLSITEKIIIDWLEYFREKAKNIIEINYPAASSGISEEG